MPIAHGSAVHWWERAPVSHMHEQIHVHTSSGALHCMFTSGKGSFLKWKL